MADQRRRKRKRKPYDYQRDKDPKRYKRDRPRCEPHQDRYVEQRGMTRSHYRADKSPKRAYLTREQAEADVLKMAEIGRKARCYQCPVCDNWHLATDRSGEADPAVGDEGVDT